MPECIIELVAFYRLPEQYYFFGALQLNWEILEIWNLNFKFEFCCSVGTNFDCKNKEKHKDRNGDRIHGIVKLNFCLIGYRDLFKMADDVDANIRKKYSIKERLGKGVSYKHTHNNNNNILYIYIYIYIYINKYFRYTFDTVPCILNACTFIGVWYCLESYRNCYG